MADDRAHSETKPDIDTGIAERRILLLGAAILTVFIVITGIGVFNIMLRQGKTVLSNGLSSSLHSRVHLFDEVIASAVSRVDVIVTRPVLIRAVRLTDHQPRDPTAIRTLNVAMQSFLKTGFVALEVLNKKKSIVDSAGQFINPKISIPIKSYTNAQLLWRDSYYLKIVRALKSRGRIVGYLSAERNLPKLDYVLSNINTLGPSAESVICGSLGSNLKCFPSRLHPKPAFHQPKLVHGHLLPMARALEGKTGLAITGDYRNDQVVAAFMPIIGTGLGMVLKVDSSDLYAPIWQTLPYVIPSLVFMVILGTLLLHWLIAPLVRYVLVSEVERRESQRLLKDRDARLRTLFNSVDEGIVVADTTGSIEEFNPGAEQIFGYSKTEVLGHNVNQLMSEPDKSRHDSYISRYLQTGESKLIGQGRELSGVKKGGEPVVLDLRLNEVNHGPDRIFVATMRDVTERKIQEEHIRFLATHDVLTGLPNRSFFLEQVTQSLSRAKRYENKVAILFLDLDRFKHVNDTYGHDAGDMLLREFAHRVRSLIRDEDMMARQGGDEFIVALAEVDDLEGAVVVAEKIQSETLKAFELGGRQLEIGVSIGIAIYPDDGDNIDALLKCADTQMYREKLASKAMS